MLDKSFIGHEFAPITAEVEKGQLKFFAEATGETDPVYFDLEAARAAGHRSLPAPPTFLFSLGFAGPDPFPVLRLMNVPLGKVLHGEQQFTYTSQIYAGDVITMTLRVLDIYDKKDGALEFIEQETVAVNQHGETVGTSRTVTVVRNG